MTQSTGLSSWANDRRYISHNLSSLESSLCIIQGMPVEAAYIFPNLKIIMVGISFLWPQDKVQVSSKSTRFVKFSNQGGGGGGGGVAVAVVVVVVVVVVAVIIIIMAVVVVVV